MALPSAALPVDDVTGLRAIAVLPSGRIVWPISGGDGTDGAADDTGGEGTEDGDGDGDTSVDWEKEAAKWKALSRKHEAAAKKNATAAQKLAETEEADKTEVQRERDRAAAAEARAKSAEVRADRLEVAIAKGLSPAMASRLQGETREELEADAEELLKALKPDRPIDTSGRPRETLRPGNAPDVKPEENDPMKLAAMIPRH